MLKLRTLLIASLFSVLLAYAEGFGACGNTYCKDGEVCETSVDGGTCFLKKSKVECNNFYYCYKPRTCCGFGECCPEDSYCDGTECRTNRSGFRSWYGGLFVVPLIAVIGVIIRYRQRATNLRVSRRRVVTTVPAQSRNNQYGYDQGPIVLGFPETSVANTEIPTDAYGPPPAYDEVAKLQAKDI